MSMTQLQYEQIVQAMLDAGVVDFAALGKLVTDLGQTLAVVDDGSMFKFCGFVQIFKLDLPQQPLENLDDLHKAVGKSVA